MRNSHWQLYFDLGKCPSPKFREYMTSPSVRSMLPDSSTSDASYNYNPVMKKRLSTSSTRAAEQLKSEIEARELEVGVYSCCFVTGKFMISWMISDFLTTLKTSCFCIQYICSYLFLGLQASIQWQCISWLH